MINQGSGSSQVSQGIDAVSLPAINIARSGLELPTNVMSQRHRSWLLGLPPQCAAPALSRPLIIAVGGGKGGVGKSLLSANLAAKLARMGMPTIVLGFFILSFPMSQPRPNHELLSEHQKTTSYRISHEFEYLEYG